jgi:hypothetical protein
MEAIENRAPRGTYPYMYLPIMSRFPAEILGFPK